MQKKLFLVLFLGLALSAPLTSFAFANTYEACDGEIDENGECDGSTTTVCYEGIVPCGQCKPYYNGGDISDGECQGGENPKGIPCQFCHFLIMLKGIIEFFLFTIIPLVAILVIALGGMRMIFSGGNPSNYQKGQNMIKWVVIGLAIIFGAWLLTNLFFSMIGVAEWTGLRGEWFEIECPVEIMDPDDWTCLDET
jgi:hypothetical protein